MTRSIVTAVLIGITLCGCQRAVLKGASVDATPASPVQETAVRPGETYATGVDFNAETGTIRYTLPEPAMVRLRIGAREGGPLLRTLLDWEERPAGEHVEKWDGKDSSGTVDFGKRNDLMAAIMCIPKGSFALQSPPKGFRKSPAFSISFPEATEFNAQHIPVVSGMVPVRIRLDDQDKTWLTEARYELKVFTDNAFLMEDEEGMNPFLFMFDSKRLNNGVHTITVNLAVYDGEIGTGSVLVAVNNI